MSSSSLPATPRDVFRQYLARQGLKASRQRDLVAEAFFKSTGHLKVEELIARVHALDPAVSQATVYRTLRLLVDCGLAEARHFFGAQTRYEQGDLKGADHDHMICTECHTIVEFFDARIEKLQKEVAARHGFVVEHQKMELYGLCPKCNNDSADI